MKNYGLLYLFFLSILMGMLFIFARIDLGVMKKHPTMNELAMEPDHMMFNATHYIREHLQLTSTEYLDRAIKAMRLIENDGDSLSNSAIEKAIVDLEAVQTEIKDKRFDPDHMSHAFVKALNSLALAQLRISEAYELSGNLNNARFAMQYALHHLQNAIHFAKGDEREMETRLFAAIDGLIANDSITEAELISELDYVIAELDMTID